MLKNELEVKSVKGNENNIATLALRKFPVTIRGKLMVKIYIAGKMRGLKMDEIEENFRRAESSAMKANMYPISPYYFYREYGRKIPDENGMKVCKILIDSCDAVFFMKNWEDSKGCHEEMEYAKKQGKLITIEGKMPSKGKEIQ